MDKCIHIKGVVDGKTIAEYEFDKVFNEHNNMVNLWFNSINKYDHGSGIFLICCILECIKVSRFK